ncbi:hypothetical protein [Bifidobacterium callimiconis]|uniref:Uncharacterized protein n=1 Tax=Bifidobacterium callimiconis TaxID=2306973 RepID=A0A430FII4_9BIFI|nr:hypothetical protein [Bifidobacterium callimiconis]RSX52610.1 hypothetical protein D2E23_0338 [Bifidobacterium callimiconis]
MGTAGTARFVPNGTKTRLSHDWFPDEWLEPVHPDIRRPFLERYATVMGRLMADYLRHQGVLPASPATDGPHDDDTADDAVDYGNDFTNLCLIVDQRHTFPIGSRNLRTLGYEPDESVVSQAAMALQMAFDEFVDAIQALPPDTDRAAFTCMVKERYGYDGDIESEELLHALAIRAARHLAEDEFALWADEESVLGADPVKAASDRLTAWTADDRHDNAETIDAVSAAFRSSRDDWLRRVGESRRNTPRSRDEVLRWCHWHAVLSLAWQRERAGEGEEWQRLIARMTIVHRTVSRIYSRWCDMMPDESDTVQLNLSVRAIASDPDFAEMGLVPLCNKLATGNEPEPAGFAEAMHRVVDYLCVGRRVEPSGGTSSELIYVGLRKAICGHAAYGGRHVNLHGEDYRRYVEMMTGSPSTNQDHATVWLFPNMEERLAAMRMRQTFESVSSEWHSPVPAEHLDAEALRFHRRADPAVSEWLAAETVHTAATDGHGHFLSYRAADPVAAYQDVNAWRLGHALETYEGARTWGSGSRLAQLYRDRGHLNKQGERALDRSIRDYAITARGMNDAVQYIAAVCGLGAMLHSTQGVETFIRLMDACDGRRDDRFRKACWTLTRAARSKRLRLTIPDTTGRQIGPQLLADHTADDAGRTLVVGELKLVNLVRAFQPVGADEAKRLLADSRNIASMLDLAEHYVHDTVATAITGLARHDRRWAAIRPQPLACVGSRMTADGVCAFGRTTAAATTTPTMNGNHR